MSADMTELALEATGLRKVYGARRGTAGFVAVDDLTFSVSPGECLAIVGESGSGKTTTARMLAGLESATAGRLVIGGIDRSLPSLKARDRQARGRDLQIVFQDPYVSLDPRQTPRSAIDEVLRLHTQLDHAGRAARVTELGDWVGLNPRQLDSMPRALSGGQRQRVAIARALACEPRTIVLDEAVSALDVSIQAQILNLLDDIRRRTNTAYVFISHDLAVVRQIADQVLVMKTGQAVEMGAAAAVLDHPMHDYTRRLLEAVPPNARRIFSTPTPDSTHTTRESIT